MHKPSVENRAWAIVESEAQKVRETGEGGRNVALNGAAFTLGGLVGSGILEMTEGVELLTQAALDTGLSPHEAKATIDSGLKAGQEKPFDPNCFERDPRHTRKRRGGYPKPSPPPLGKVTNCRPLTPSEWDTVKPSLYPIELGSAAHAERTRRGLPGAPQFQAWQTEKGQFAFEVRGPDGQPWAVKVRTAEQEGQRYRYLTKEVGAPAWASLGYGKAKVKWYIEGELNAVAADHSFRHIGCTVDVQGMAGVSGKPHTEDLKGATVYVYADPDKAGNEASLKWAQAALEAGAAQVFTTSLPEGLEGDFCDVLGQQGPEALVVLLTQLEKEAKPYQAQVKQGSVLNSSPYFIDSGALCWNRTTQGGGTVAVRLANFTAYIAAQTVRDDGAEREHLLTLTGQLASGKPLPRIDVPSLQFGGMNWVLSQWGAEAIIQPGQAIKDNLRAAIQQLSQDEMEQRHVHAFTGWIDTPEGAAYLHAGGAIGQGGPLSGLEVDLPKPLEHYRFPEPLSGSALAEGVRACLRILDLVPDEVIAPLFAGIWRAVLDRSDFAFWLVGATGQGKSELAALLLQHFGADMDARHFPGNWSSTPNSLEGLAFAAQHALMVIDDFAPQGSPQDIARYHSTAERLLRAQGNNAGRGRMTAQGQARPEKYPRGLLIATGEDVPNGHSARARTLVVEMPRGGMNWGILTGLQKQAKQGVLAGVMAAFIQWLAPNIRTMPEQRQEALEWGRARFTGIGHARTVSAVSELMWSSKRFLDFATTQANLDVGEASALRDRFTQALLRCLESQAQHHSHADPVTRFLDVLWAMLSGGQAHLADLKTGGTPTTDPSRYGWKVYGQEGRGSGPFLGWVDDAGVYINQEAAFKEVTAYIRGQGGTLPMSQQTLWKRLAERKLIRQAEKDRNTVKVTVSGSRRTVIHILQGGYGSEDGTTGTVGAQAVSDSVNAVPLPEIDGTAQIKNGTARIPETLPFSDCPDMQRDSIGESDTQGNVLDARIPDCPESPVISKSSPADIEREVEAW